MLITGKPLGRKPLSTPRLISDTLSERENIVRMTFITDKPLKRTTIVHSKDRRLWLLRNASVGS